MDAELITATAPTASTTCGNSGGNESAVWSIDVLVTVFSYLYPSDQWSLRRVCRSWRLSIDHLQNVFYPFAVLQEDHPTLLGTFCFSTQEVLLVTTAQPLKILITHGKGRVISMPQLPDIAEEMADALLNVMPNFVGSCSHGDCPEEVERLEVSSTMTKEEERERQPRRYRRVGLSGLPMVYFVFSDTIIVTNEQHTSTIKATLHKKLAAANVPAIQLIALPLPNFVREISQAQQRQQEQEPSSHPPAVPEVSSQSDPPYKPGTVWLDADNGGMFTSIVRVLTTPADQRLHFSISKDDPSPLQWWIHKQIMTTVSTTGSARDLRRRRRGYESMQMGLVEDTNGDVDDGIVENYNAYYGNGAVLYSHYEAMSAFGQPYAPHHGFRNPLLDLQSHLHDWASGDAGAAAATTSPLPAGVIPWQGLPTFSGLREMDYVHHRCGDSKEGVAAATKEFIATLGHSVWMVTNGDPALRHRTSRYVSMGGKPASNVFVARYPKAKLHLGATPSGAEAVIEAHVIANHIPSYHFAAADSSVRLYIADNTFFAEAYDKEFLLPSDVLEYVWHAMVERDAAAETDAPNIHGRPLNTPWILWGAEGTFSTPHVEPSASCVWVHVFEGSKTWCIFNDLTHRWESFVQPAGTTVFMGRGIWHAVINNGTPTFATACNYIPLSS